MKNVLRVIFILFCLCLLYAGNRPPVAPLLSAEQLDFKFTRLDRQTTGIDFRHERNDVNLPLRPGDKYWSSMTGASVSVADFNNDGFFDVFFSNNKYDSDNALFKNNGDGSFTNVTQRAGLSGMNKDGITMRGLFFDCDNDGTKELLLLRSSCHRLMKVNPKNGAYQDITEKSGIDDCVPALAANVYDYNRDGFLDFVLAGNRTQGHRSLVQFNSMINADNGGETVFYENQGQCRFVKKEVFGKRPLYFHHAVGIGDLQNSDRYDVWFATDFNDDKIYLQQSDDTYELVDDRQRFVNSKTGMSAEIAYLGEDDKPSVYVTHIYRKFYMTGGNALWKMQQGKLVNTADDLKISRCGFSWGAKFFDLNNDGRLDLYVANGGISLNPNKDYFFPFSVMTSTIGPWSADQSRWPPYKDQSFSGYEQDCLYYEKDGRYLNLAETFNVDPNKADGRGVAIVDYSNTGNQSVIVANMTQFADLYRLEQKNSNKWLGLQLEGTKSNRDGIGAKVKLHLADRTLYRQVFPFNGYAAQSDSRVHFGLGANPVVKSIEVLWPSGIKQTVVPEALNTYLYIKEAQP